ncbi:hypothetical protein L6R52_43410, partial [Myxococcota bacterium]|nr:hypothetical protein [Myxococcota bacterium]
EPLVCGEDGTCALPPEVACERDRDCMVEGEICVEGVCTAATPCTTSKDCPADQRCIRDFCRAPCTEASDCGPQFAWTCEMGECIQRCTNDGQCPAQTICESFLCVPAECASNEECESTTTNTVECQGADAGHGRCVEVFPCDAGCPEGTGCNTQTNRCEALDRCVSDRACAADEYCEGGYCQPSTSCTAASCAAGLDCVGGVCVPAVCRGDADCTTAGERCIAGACTTPPAPTRITQVRILTPAGVVRPGTTYTFVAVALDQTGAVVPGLTFDWTSTSTNVASIDASGVATGGSRAGTTTIVASLFNGTTTISSPGVALVNLGALATGDVRVSVVGLSGGSAIAGATVTIEGSFGVLTQTTPMSGVATFAGAAPTGPIAVTVTHGSFDWVTLLGVEASDVLVPLPPLSRPSIAAGIKGTVDLSAVRSTGALSISLNGTSLSPPLAAFDAASLFGGGLFRVTIPNPQGGGNITVPVPAGATLGVEFVGTQIPLKDTYYTLATPGLRAAWGLGGKIGLDALGGGTGGGLGNIVGTILPYLQRFDHAVRPVVDVVGLPTVVDTGDIDGDGDTAELVPDYGNFPAVPLRPATAQSLRYQIEVDNLPFVSGGNANTLIVVAGTILPSVGFVPLGLDGLQDDAGNGIVPPFVTKIAPPHSGLEVGDYAVLASAMRLDAGGLPGPGSSRLLVASRLPATVDLS